MKTARDAAVEPQPVATDLSDLGRRVVQAARLAVAVHLHEASRAAVAAHSGRRLVIGGAGPVVAAAATGSFPGSGASGRSGPSSGEAAAA